MKTLTTIKVLLLKLKNDIEDLRGDMNQLLHKNNLHIYNPVEDFGFEMPFTCMDEFLTFDKTLIQKDTSDKFVRFPSHKSCKKIIYITESC